MSGKSRVQPTRLEQPNPPNQIVTNIKQRIKWLLVGFLPACLLVLNADAIDPKLTIKIELGDVGRPAYYHYQLIAVNEAAVGFTLWEGQSKIETGEFEYPNGFKGFTDDLWEGFVEASGKYDYERRDKGGNDLMIQLKVTMGSGLNTISVTYRGNVDGFTRFGGGSVKLQRPLSALSNGRPMRFHLWGVPSELKK